MLTGNAHVSLPCAQGPTHCLTMPAEYTQFARESVPSSRGLAPNTKPIAQKPIGVRFYEEDVEPLNSLLDRSGLIREATHVALLAPQKGPDQWVQR